VDCAELIIIVGPTGCSCIYAAKLGERLDEELSVLNVFNSVNCWTNCGWCNQLVQLLFRVNQSWSRVGSIRGSGRVGSGRENLEMVRVGSGRVSQLSSGFFSPINIFNCNCILHFSMSV
jgi:hypothetical protein